MAAATGRKDLELMVMKSTKSCSHLNASVRTVVVMQVAFQDDSFFETSVAGTNLESAEAVDDFNDCSVSPIDIFCSPTRTVRGDHLPIRSHCMSECTRR